MNAQTKIEPRLNQNTLRILPGAIVDQDDRISRLERNLRFKTWQADTLKMERDIAEGECSRLQKLVDGLLSHRARSRAPLWRRIWRALPI